MPSTQQYVTDPASSLGSTKGVPFGCTQLCKIKFVTLMNARITSTMLAFLPAQYSHCALICLPLIRCPSYN